MKSSETTFLLTLGTIASFCAAVVVLSAGCDLGTYGERVQSTGGTLPVTTVSQDSGSDSKDSQAGSDKKGSDSKDAGSESDSRDSGRKSKRDDPGKKKVTSLADIKEKTDARRAQQEAEGRARAADGR